MKRFVLALTTGALVAFMSVVPAAAQTEDGYGGDPSAPPSGCPVAEPPVEDPPPCTPRTDAGVTDPDVQPGDPVTVTAPPVFAPGSAVVVNLVRASNGAQANELATGTAGSNGSVSETVTIPETAPGVYFMYITGLDSDGNLVVALTTIVVRAGSQAASVAGDSVTAAGFSAPVPAAVAEVQTVTPEVEAAAVDAVTTGAGAPVLSPDGRLSVPTAAGVQRAGALPTTGSDGIAEQVTVGAAMLLAGTGLVLLRRRRGGFTK